jgi:hypothetical protein
MRRAAVVSAVGLTVVVMLLRFLPWGLAVVVGWDAAALTLLVSIWPIILWRHCRPPVIPCWMRSTCRGP